MGIFSMKVKNSPLLDIFSYSWRKFRFEGEIFSTVGHIFLFMKKISLSRGEYSTL
jgi:hypothetical protein